MQIAALPRWQWIIIAIIVGTIVGFITDSADSRIYGLDVQNFGTLLPDQSQFENGLVQDYNGTHLFNNPVVYPHWDVKPDGSRKLVYIVTGDYWDGHPEEKDGKLIGQPLPRCVITQAPYTPHLAIVDSTGIAPQQYPSVVEFLEALHRNYKVSYRYAWWALHPVLTWVVGCLIVIGGIWPTVANVLAFGTFTRPPEIKPTSLWNVRLPKSKPLESAAIPSDTSSESDQPAGSHAAVTPEAAPTKAPALATAPLEVTPLGPREQRDFGADQDDFYPTERHSPRENPPK
jgi:hypothetical protein